MLYGGVLIIMCCMREKYWILKLRFLVKIVIYNCNVCKCYWKKLILIFRSLDLILLVFRIELINFFFVIGVDFVGFVNYKINKFIILKVYIVLFICISICVVYLKLCYDLFV